jgi:hypothetical protein
LLAVPILTSTGLAVGVVEMVNKTRGQFCPRDLHLLTTFAQFASVALEHNRLKDIAHLGDVELETAKWIGDRERDGYAIPKNLIFTDAQKLEVSSIACFAVNYHGIGHFQALFYFYNVFNLLETFKVTNERFFRFIFNVSAKYNAVPYHNWTHACDVAQFVTYELKSANLEQTFTSLEIFGLLTVAICHDLNHEGLNNIYNVKAETPYGILFKDMSVMEMRHITHSIPIITDDSVHLFRALSSDQVRTMWHLFINLILSTDMAKHFGLMSEATRLLDAGEWCIDNPEHRLMAMKIILKVADISNVSRPFEIANKWCDILCDEFYRQGDLEKQTGIGLTSPLNDREHNDKPKSQIGFYNFICLPLYQVNARIWPPLRELVDAVSRNLERWKTLSAQ